MILPKESLNSDGHQFHQYQQKEQLPLIGTKLTTQIYPRHMMLEIQILAWDKHTHMVVLNRLMASQPSPMYLQTQYIEYAFQ